MQKNKITNLNFNTIYSDFRPTEESVLFSKYNLNRTQLREMLTDTEIQRCVFIRRSTLTKSQFHFICDNKNTEQFLLDTFSRHVPKMLESFWNANLFGYSVTELKYKKDNNQYKLKNTEEIPFEYFYPSADGEIWTILNVDGNQYKLNISDTNDIYNYKYIFNQNSRSYNNPYGTSILLLLYSKYLMRHYAYKFWSSWVERYCDPLLVIKTLPSKIDEMVTQVSLGTKTAVIGVDKNDEIEAIKTDGNGGTNYNAFIQNLNSEIQKLILGQEVSSERKSAMGVEGFKLADKITDNIYQHDLETCFAKVQEVLNKYLALNGITDSVKIIYDVDDGLNLDRLAIDTQLKQAGIIENVSEEYLIKHYGYQKGDFTLLKN